MSEIPANIDGRLGHDVTIIDGGGARIEGRLRSYHPQPSVTIELSDGTFVSYPVTMVQQRPLRERIAELLDDEHGQHITEGGCDFQVQHRGGDVDAIVDQIIALVRSEPGTRETGIMHIKSGGATVCGLAIGEVSHVTDGFTYADCTRCLRVMVEKLMSVA